MYSDIQKITEGFRSKVERDGGLERGTLKFNLGEGVVYIDGNCQPNIVSNEDKPADCTLSTTTDVIRAMIAGQVDGLSALKHGKISLEGDMRIIMAFGPIGVNRSIATPVELLILLLSSIALS